MNRRKKRNTSSNYRNKNKNYKTIYSKSDYQHDEQTFDKSIKSGNVDFSSFKRLMLSDICTNTHLLDTGYVGDICLEDIQVALKCPKSNWRMLLAISEQLMRISPHYYRLNNLYSNMALFCWGIDLYDIKDSANKNTIKKVYTTLASKLESMNLKHEFAKIMKVLPYQDVYCGLVMENDTDFFIQQVNFNICKLYQIQDGLYNFAINLAMIKPQNLYAYPDYVQQAYLDFTDGKIANWYLPSADKQICIKLNSQWTYPYPLLIGLVKDILDLDTYKKLKLQSARTDNYKAILVEVPIDKNTIDKPLLTPETLGIFAEINRESMSDDIGLIHTLGSTGQAISFKDSSNTRNNVSDSVEALYDSSGVSSELFNSSSTATAITMAIENASGFIYGVYRQFERWVNRYIKLRKYNRSNFKFNFYLLDTTIFNRDKVTGRYKDAIAFGSPIIDKYLASIDMTPSKILGSYVVHEDIFDFRNHFIPLQTSYNSSVSSEDTIGRPLKNDEELTESGEQTRESDANKDR